jgi:hypothetical protein
MRLLVTKNFTYCTYLESFSMLIRNCYTVHPTQQKMRTVTGTGTLARAATFYLPGELLNFDSLAPSPPNFSTPQNGRRCPKYLGNAHARSASFYLQYAPKKKRRCRKNIRIFAALQWLIELPYSREISQECTVWD